MFLLLPLIALPFLIAAAAYRLYTLPRRYLAGTLRLAHHGSSPISLLAGLAYLALLACTVGIILLVARNFIHAPYELSGWLALAPAIVGYPIGFVAAEWVFYHGFQRPSRLEKSSGSV